MVLAGAALSSAAAVLAQGGAVVPGATGTGSSAAATQGAPAGTSGSGVPVTTAPTVAAPATATAAATASDSGEVLVVAEAGPQQAIDRKSYVVRQGPAAEIATGLEAMRDLPSVSIDAAGRIELLGNANVRILIDGRPVPDALSILRSLTAAQIARIEVITNPSAQFPAEGTAGIINVITRRSSRDGLGGTLSAGVDSRGGGSVRAGPSWTQGKWSLSTSPTLFASRGPTESRLERERVAGPADAFTDRSERTTARQYNKGMSARSALVYRPTEKRSVSLALTTVGVDFGNDAETRITPRAGGLPTVDQRGDSDGSFRSANLAADYRAEGNKAGELLTASLSGSVFGFDNRARIVETPVAGGAAGRFESANSADDRQATLKLDYATPVAGTRRLTVGGSVDWRRRRLTDRSLGTPLLGPARNAASDFAGEYVEGAGYATFQTVVGGFKLLPGLRVQGREYSLDDLGGDGPSRIDAFPSMFVERKLDTRLTAALSYSRRIGWPDIGDLSPLLRIQSPIFAIRGDPALLPETTDAFEARLSYGGKIHSFDLTLYDRITRDTFDRRIVLAPDGTIISTPVNAGRRVDQGLEAGFRGRVAKPLRYALTGNLTAVTRDIGTIGNRRRDAQYRAKLQLDYTDGKSSDPGFDQITFNLRYEGPTRQFQTRRDDYFDADASWTHRFTARLALVTSATALLGGVAIRTETRTPFILERRRDEGIGRTFRLTLTYQLSDRPQAQPPQPSAGGGVPTVPIP